MMNVCVCVLIIQSHRNRNTHTLWLSQTLQCLFALSGQPFYVLLLTELHVCFQVRRDLIKAIPLLLISLPPFANYLVFVLMWVAAFSSVTDVRLHHLTFLPLTVLSQVLLPPAGPDPSFLESQTAGGVSRSVPLSSSSAPPACHQGSEKHEQVDQRWPTPVGPVR